MKNRRKKQESILQRDWVLTLLGLFILQLIFIICDQNGWSLNFKDNDEGTFFAKLSNSKFFTEWFTLYNKPEFNLFTVFFGITLLPYAIIAGIKDLSSRKQTNNHTS
ncbi:YfzA family protein [Priestia endophytica]|uniref:YfzA family protein n=1 Tax=Priestia endophytica TaxID=135735 RepID=UPI00124EA0D4|nr:YfzA family protein [Priestia endophytica]KAB2488216.1 hypothetical protein F8155_25380 [Priestia endophytica]